MAGPGKNVPTESSSWKTAETYTDAPHEYILALDQPEILHRFSELLKENGAKEEFTLRGKTATYRYYYPGDGYKYYWIIYYWIIGRVLNRSKIQEAT
jgi:hypothetical protein